MSPPSWLSWLGLAHGSCLWHYYGIGRLFVTEESKCILWDGTAAKPNVTRNGGGGKSGWVRVLWDVVAAAAAAGENIMGCHTHTHRDWDYYGIDNKQKKNPLS